MSARGDTTRALDRVCAGAEGHVRATAAIEELAGVVRRYKPSIYATCLRLLADPVVAVEVTRDVIRELYRRLPELGDAMVRARTWIVEITVREVFARVRAVRELLLEDGVLDARDPGARRWAELSAAERREVVARASAGLDPPAAQVVWLRYAERLPYETIDRVLGRAGSRDQAERARVRFSRRVEQQLVCA